MQLPDFINRMLGFQAKVEGHFTAAEQLKNAEALITAQAVRITELEAASTAFTVQITDLTQQLEAGRAENAKNLEALTAANAAIEAEKKKNIAVVADQGLPADQIPSQGPNENASGQTAAAPKSIAEQAIAAAHAKAKARK